MASNVKYPHIQPSGLRTVVEGFEARTLSGNLDLSAAPFSLPEYARLDPGGASRNVTLEAEAAAAGVFREFYNAADAAENLVLKDDAGVTLWTVGPRERLRTWCDGTTWLLVNRSTDMSFADITDPGNAGAISVASSGSVSLVSAGAETRTLAAPIFNGQIIVLYFQTDGGDCVVTVASAFNQTGNTVITLNDAGDSVSLIAVHNGTTLAWRVLENGNASLS